MSCTCDINIKYSYDATGSQGPFTDYDVIVAPSGLRNGRSTYTWNDGVVERILYWETTGSYWVIALIELGVETELGVFIEQDTECPGSREVGDTTTPVVTWNISKGYELYYETFTVENICAATTADIAEKINCHNLKVWQLQCSFSACVEAYFNGLAYGINNEHTFEKLLTTMYGLQILNNYDPRDIFNNTTDYNIISYDEILNILSKLKTL